MDEQIKKCSIQMQWDIIQMPPKGSPVICYNMIKLKEIMLSNHYKGTNTISMYLYELSTVETDWKG